ncbi:MAG: lysophospholipid acyltransferase family protein, partial [Bryobacterales bacterium]|nr:lysophospholipid acyltransferase family protein [Bryobacterales bacterium]
EGPVLVVANHPFGLVEAVIIGAILSRMRGDVKFLANSLLAAVPQLHDLILPVDISGGSTAARSNLKAVREAVAWLQGGHVLVVFPAGEVASIQFPPLGITDPRWNNSVTRLVERTNAAVLPIFVHGANGPAFHIAGAIHPQFRTLLLPREFLNKQGKRIRVSIGSPIRSNRILTSEVRRDPTEYLRKRTFLLESRSGAKGRTRFEPRLTPVAAGIDPALLANEIATLPAGQTLLSHAGYTVYEAAAAQIPSVLREIGRLREITFRGAGEGTGNSIDLDEFDRHYRHLILWNVESREVVGAYRFARTDEVLSRFGPRGLYTHTLFRLSPEFHASVGPALELGRSFVRPEYQKSYQALLLLWKGIGQYLVSHPRYRYLFGPVSISRDYSACSRAVMVSFLKARCGDEALASSVQPRHKFQVRPIRDLAAGNLGSLLANVDELSEVIADLEPDHKGVPILLRHYVNLGGRILDFSVDRNFSNTLDGLIVVDLAAANRRLLERYLGKAGAEKFLDAGQTA